MGNVSDKLCRGNQNTHVVFSNLFFKLTRLLDNVEKYCRTRQAKNDDMVHAHCMMDTQGYKYTLRKCNTYFSHLSSRCVSINIYNKFFLSVIHTIYSIIQTKIEGLHVSTVYGHIQALDLD